MNSPAEPGGIVSRAIILNAKLSVHARLLYAVLVVLADEHRECTRSRAELAIESGLSDSTVKRAMRELTEAEIVEIYSSKSEHGGFSANCFRVLDHPGVTQTPPHSGGVSETPPWGPSDPTPQETPAQTLGQRDPRGGVSENPGVGSERPQGAYIDKKGESVSRFPTGVTSNERYEHTTPIRPEPGPPAPEDDRPMTMLNFNGITIPTEKGATKRPARSRLKYDYDEPFLAAWEAYGKVGGKQQAWQAWKAAADRVTPEVIMAAIPLYLASDAPRRGYTKHFSTWLNNDGWESAECQPKKPGYQGRAGSDARPQEEYNAQAQEMPIHRHPRHGLGETLPICRAWYYHWHVGEQREWTREQLLATGNTPEDVDWLMDAYAHGIDSALYTQLVELYSLTPHGSDA